MSEVGVNVIVSMGMDIYRFVCVFLLHILTLKNFLILKNFQNNIIKPFLIKDSLIISF